MDYDEPGAEVIAFPTADSPERERAEDERALDEMGLRHDLDANGYVRVNRCYHHDHPAQVDHANRKVTCKGCGAIRDPYEVLERLASHNHGLVGQRQRLRREIRHLADRVADLKREERNTKSRIRTAKKGYRIERRGDGWPLCPACGEDSLVDRQNPVPLPTGDLWCESCKQFTMRRGVATKLDRPAAVGSANPF